MSAKEVLMLEIKDKYIRKIFRDIYEKFDLGKVKQPHITIRGPYSNSASHHTIEKIMKRLGHNLHFRISGVGKFDSDNEFVVYLIVVGDDLKQLWWKPDFPIGRVGFNPHVTVYKGDRTIGENVYEYLVNEDFDFEVKDVKLKVKPLRQEALDFGD